MSTLGDGGDLSEILSALRRGKGISFAEAARPTPDEMITNAAHVWETLGFPADLALTRAQSEFLAPRDPRTTDAFASIVNEIFVPTLKHARFTKRRYVWRRRLATIENAIDIQRSHATGDLLRFTVNWAITIPSFEAFPRRAPGAVVEGRIGDFNADGDDQWWSIQLGWLARDTPQVSSDSGQCREEITSGVAQIVAWLDELDTVPRLIAAVEEPDGPLRNYERGYLFETSARLKRLPPAP